MTEQVENNIEPVLPENINFNDSVNALEVRAKRARRTMLMIGAVLVLVIQFLVTFIFYQYQNQEVSIAKSTFGFSSRSLSGTLEARGAQLAEKLYSIESDSLSAEKAHAQLQETVNLIKDLQSVENRNNDSSSGFAFNLSAVAL